MMNTSYRIKSLEIDIGRRKDIQTKYSTIKYANTALKLICTPLPDTDNDHFAILVTFGRNVSEFRGVSMDGGRVHLRVRKMYKLIDTEWSINEQNIETSTTLNEPLVSVAFGGMFGNLIRSHIPPYQQAEWDDLMSRMRRLILEGGYFIPKALHESASSVWERTTRKSLQGLHAISSEAAERRRQLVMRLAHWR